MAEFQVGFDKGNKKVRVMAEGASASEGFEIVGSFSMDAEDASGPKFNRVLQNEIRDILYPLGQQNMQEVQISVDPEAYEQANGSFYPQSANAVGTALAPNAATDENTENSVQVDKARRKAKRARTDSTKEDRPEDEGNPTSDDEKSELEKEADEHGAVTTG